MEPGNHERAARLARPRLPAQGSLYAHAGIPQYLLLDLNRESLELFSDPVSGVYLRHQTFKRGERVPLGDLSDAFLEVADQLP